MRLMVIFACFLGTCGPLLVAGQKKIMIIIPRTTRRAHNNQWRQFIRPPFTQVPKFLDERYLPSRDNLYQNKKIIPKGKSIFNQHLPQGGDDFDQGHDGVNHVVIPHGKGISHAITYGHGYVPHGVLKDHAGFSEAPSPLGQTEDNRMNYYSPPHVTHQADNYLHREEEETNHHNNPEIVQERRAEDRRQTYFSPSVHNKLFTKIIYGNPKKPIYASESSINPSKQIFPTPPFNSNKDEFVIRDSVDLGNYHKELMELTRNWPAALNISPSTSQGFNSNIGPSPHNFPGNPFRPSDYQGANFLSSYAPQHQGYAVKEDVEDIPHDFQTASIQNPPPQEILQAGPQNFHGISQSPFPANVHYGFSGVPGHLQTWRN